MAIQKYMQIMVVDTYSNLPVTADTAQIAYCLDTKLSLTFDGTQWTNSNRVSIKKSSVIVNGKNTGTTKIYTLEDNGSNFLPTMVIMRNSNISGVIIKPTVSFGSNVSSYDNIATGSLLSTLLSTLGASAGVPQIATVVTPLAGGTDIYANVSIAASATTYSFKVDLLGYYE
jgi:hypothetical protein